MYLYYDDETSKDPCNFPKELYLSLILQLRETLMIFLMLLISVTFLFVIYNP